MPTHSGQKRGLRFGQRPAPEGPEAAAPAGDDAPPLTAEETLEQMRDAGVRAEIVGTGKDAKVYFGRLGLRALTIALAAIERRRRREHLRFTEEPTPVKTYLEAAALLPDPFGIQLERANAVVDEVNRRRAAGQPAPLSADEQAKREAKKTARQQRKDLLAYRRAQAQHAGHRRLSRFNAAVPKDLR